MELRQYQHEYELVKELASYRRPEYYIVEDLDGKLLTKADVTDGDSDDTNLILTK